MLAKSEVQGKFEKVQKQLCYMIPEKWDRVYLYASVIDDIKEAKKGEMFFYYFPKGILKKNPVNVYEVPNKFNLDEQDYLKLAQDLYDTIKSLRKQQIKAGENPWSNLTISIEEFKFTVKYDYEDLQTSSYTNYDRHLVWRHQYLGFPLSSYSKKERNMIEEYLKRNKHKISNRITYQEGFYKKPVNNMIQYNKLDEKQEISHTQVDDVIKKRKNENRKRKFICNNEDLLYDDHIIIKSQILAMKLP